MKVLNQTPIFNPRDNNKHKLRNIISLPALKQTWQINKLKWTELIQLSEVVSSYNATCLLPHSKSLNTLSNIFDKS